MIKNGISLIFPMYNEKEYLPMAVTIAKMVLEDITTDCEIIIVDDGSTDGSGKIADDLASADTNIKVIHHNRNRKLGSALKTGFSNATKDIIIYTDMDLPFDLTLLNNIIPLILEFDIVVGSRIGHRESLLRTIYSLVYNGMINFIFRLRIKDVNFALKIFKRKILNKINLKSKGSFINAEFLAKAKKLGYLIKEFDVEYRPRTHGISRLSTPPVICKMLCEMIKLYPEIRLFSRKKAMYKEVKKLYKKANLSTKIYNLIRFKTCPFDLIKEFIPDDGPVVDLGCGTGFFLNLLSLDTDKRLFIGVDHDENKINIAKGALGTEENKKFAKFNIINDDIKLTAIPKSILLIDVLYTLDFNAKKKLLKSCFSLLEPGGVLIVKDAEKALNAKFLWTFLQEFLVNKIFHFNLNQGIYFENRKTYLSLIEESGFIPRVFDLSRGYIYSHILFIGTKVS